ncbi:unnamed protein product [Hermetia illucens]|uniref:Pseudouridine synthase RsuA/RluA-like domain-containing protein n=1 Tax=Hermetia illucens TaxID=343691 RepID=A0A7R8UR19_HERIL|nr:RNA pseudouridylate synthase domain-containing protein 1-like isoform X2 [Hermetia illucens]CAD7085048.1 unnamed protein product [Hermetia illucens]
MDQSREPVLHQNTFLLHRSENFLVIDKPPDLLINSNDYRKISVQTILREQFPELKDSSLTHEFYFAHRLDYSTSGILCIPLNKVSCTAVSKAFEHRTSKKYYIALLNGHVNQKFTTVDIEIGDDSRYEKTNKKMCTTSELEFCKNPRKCVTHIVVLEKGSYNNREATKVLIKPITGRRHQIRVHCQIIGHPIIGDYTYGLAEDKLVPRMFLHAIKLVIPNTVEGIEVETRDPFNEHFLPEWKPYSEVPTELEDAYSSFDERN